MTTRRGFLSILLAAAPLVAPTLAKAAAETRFASGGYVRGIAGGSFGVVGEAGHEFPLTPKQMAELHRITDPVSGLTFDIANYDGTIGPLDMYGWAVPNRLKGTTINDEGDAI